MKRPRPVCFAGIAGLVTVLALIGCSGPPAAKEQPATPEHADHEHGDHESAEHEHTDHDHVQSDDHPDDPAK